MGEDGAQCAGSPAPDGRGRPLSEHVFGNAQKHVAPILDGDTVKDGDARFRRVLLVLRVPEEIVEGDDRLDENGALAPLELPWPIGGLPHPRKHTSRLGAHRVKGRVKRVRPPVRRDQILG